MNEQQKAKLIKLRQKNSERREENAWAKNLFDCGEVGKCTTIDAKKRLTHEMELAAQESGTEFYDALCSKKEIEKLGIETKEYEGMTEKETEKQRAKEIKTVEGKVSHLRENRAKLMNKATRMRIYCGDRSDGRSSVY